jgi:hypothetical protein
VSDDALHDGAEEDGFDAKVVAKSENGTEPALNESV